MESRSTDKPIRVIQFTDTHFFANPDGRLLGVDTADTFAQVLALARGERGVPDVYLFTGDLTQDETTDSYQRLTRALGSLEAPAYYLPGNHDRRGDMAKVLSGSGPFSNDASFGLGNWAFILLNTQVEHQVGGYLSADELRRLDDFLATATNKHVCVAMHHHPIPIGSAWIDQIKVENGDEFLQIIDKHQNVRLVVCGHVHQEFATERKGVPFIATPSTCVQFAPKSANFAIDAVPPGYRWLEFYPNGEIKTQVSRVAHVAAGLDLSSHGY